MELRFLIKEKRGFTYIIIVIVIMMLTTMLFLLSKSNLYQENKALGIINNYKTELNYLTKNNIDENNLNLLNKNFKDFIKSNNYSSKICNIYFDGDKYFLSNYQGEDYTLIDNNQTIYLLESEVLEDINFGECIFEVSGDDNLKFYIEIYNDQEKKTYSQ